MICPKCSTTNPDDGKFCKECGARLVADAPSTAGPVDDMSGALLDLWRCYDAGNLDEALAHAEELLNKLPDSASARSVVALVWERKSERELAAGNLEGGVNALRRAISEYEAILRLNPGSAADKSKLVALRRRLSGDISEPRRGPRVLRVWRYALQWPPKNLPVPLIAGVGVGVFVLIAGMLMFGGGKQPEQPGAQDQSAQYGAAPYGYQTPQGEQYPQQVQPPVNPEPGQQSYASPQPQNPPPVYNPTPQPRRTYTPNPSRPSGYLPPYALPSVGDGMTVVPDSSRRRSPGNGAKPAQDEIQPKPPTPADSEVRAVEEPSPVPDDKQDADSMFLKAKAFHNRDNDELARAAAQQAIGLYENEIRAGRDVERCRRGIENAKRLMAVLKENPEQQ